MNVPSPLFRYRWLAGGVLWRGPREARAVDQEDVRPPVVVVVDDGDAAAGGLEDVVLGPFAADDRARVEPGRGGEIAEIGNGRGRRRTWRGTALPSSDPTARAKRVSSKQLIHNSASILSSVSLIPVSEDSPVQTRLAKRR